MFSYLRFQFKRRSRRARSKVITASIWFTNYIDRHLVGAWRRLANSRTMFIAWLLITVIAAVGLVLDIQTQSTHYLVTTAAQGGVYSEGLSGNVRGVNPLFIDNPATADVSSVVYSGLTRINNKRDVEIDLAKSYEISPDKKTYTFVLKDNLVWQDNTPLTTEDIAFTIKTIQNPDTRSTLASNWANVKIEVVDPKIIRFSLPISYTSFLANTTVGILPKHLLDDVRPSLLRTHEFNQKPIGSGPFILQPIKNGDNELTLKPFEKYYNGKPHLDTLKFVLYPSSDDFIPGYARREILGFPITKPDQLKTSKTIEDITIHHLTLPVYAATFFNMKSQHLADPKLRQALAYSIDRNSIINNQLDGQATKAYYPVLAGYSGYNPNLPRYEFDINKAKSLVAEIGQEKVNSTTISLATLKNSSYQDVAKAIKQMWERLGLKVEIITLNSDEFTQNVLRPRAYDAALYGQDLGIDSDAYSYWHSSQTSDPGLNISQYSNLESDKMLEAGRIAKDLEYKKSRYDAFLQQWTKDVPAVILYTPFYNYAQNTGLKGFDARKIAEPSNRFYNIQNWHINTVLIPKSAQR